MLEIPHVVDPVEVDEIRAADEAPAPYAIRLAREKATAGSGRHPGRWVLAADTIVVIGEHILEKPASPAEAEAMLQRLSGRQHEVITAIALARDGVIHERHDVTRVRFRRLSPELIVDYVATGEPLDKAGAYGIQGKGAVLVERVDGDYFSVMGLPVGKVVELLQTVGQPYHFTR